MTDIPDGFSVEPCAFGIRRRYTMTELPVLMATKQLDGAIACTQYRAPLDEPLHLRAGDTLMLEGRTFTVRPTPLNHRQRRRFERAWADRKPLVILDCDTTNWDEHLAAWAADDRA